MTFNSIIFALFFPIVLFINYVLPGHVRKYYHILCSCIFYSLYGIQSVAVLVLVTSMSYFVSGFIVKNKSKIILLFSIFLTVSPLVILKYTTFINNIAASVGLSFFTLQAISYIVDVYRGDCNIISFSDYCNYMFFFPTIISGPIKRVNDFINNQCAKVTFNYERVRRGIYMMALGYVEKIFLADSCSKLVSYVYDGIELQAGSIIVFATVTYGLQLYFDFAGYSYIAIGAASILGYDIHDNFKQPYFAISVKDFWRRWHISLSGFLRDYVYIPLGGSRCSVARKYINLMLTFIVSGIWHGVGINFIIWGALHGVYQVAGDIKNRFIHSDKKSNVTVRVIKSVIVFILVDYAWLFFRVKNVSDGFLFTVQIIKNFDVGQLFGRLIFDVGLNKIQLCLWIAVAIMIFVIDVLLERKQDVFAVLCKLNILLRWTIYTAVIFILVIGILSSIGRDASAFIYGKF